MNVSRVSIEHPLRACACVRVDMCVFVQMWMLVCVHVCVQKCVYVCVCAWIEWK